MTASKFLLKSPRNTIDFITVLRDIKKKKHLILGTRFLGKVNQIELRHISG